MKIGLIGCGNIGRFLLDSINNQGLLTGGKIVSVLTRRPEVGHKIAQDYQTNYCSTIEELFQSEAELIVEAATIEVAQKYTLQVIESGRDMVLSSVGVLADTNLMQSIRRISSKNKVSVIVPTGAIGGLDIIKSANAAHALDKVSITTIKPPSALPDSESIKSLTTLFEGSAAEAIQLFPKNINVAIALSLAGIGAERTLVTIKADPMITRNTHIIEASGSFGNFKLQVENKPMPNNPRTSYLAALSILSTLQNIENSIRVG